jgi:hypothetical protein
MFDEIGWQYGDGRCQECGLIWASSKRQHHPPEECLRCGSSNTIFEFHSMSEEDLIMGEILEPRDYAGNVIKTGYTVVYPVRQGSDMWLQHMVISHIEIIRAATPVFKLHGTNSDNRVVKLQHPNRCVVIKTGA